MFVDYYCILVFFHLIKPNSSSAVSNGSLCVIQVKVSKPDGSPAVNESILVTARDYNNGLYMEKVFDTNQMGEIDYSICQGVMDNTSSLNMAVSDAF